MELKPHNLMTMLRSRAVLIGPSWNWNNSMPHLSSDSMRVLIGPSWNWNHELTVAIKNLDDRFNRTFMELKQEKAIPEGEKEARF